MRFEEVQRFILAKKVFWGYGHFNIFPAIILLQVFLLCIFRSLFSLPAILHFQKKLASDALINKNSDTHRFCLIRYRS